ncbi:MAG TPA: DUF1846 domain-containing protein [Bacteroidales bacterium]|nr:DUF1846 domain-containing protein [Bacteroidales bacterium]
MKYYSQIGFDNDKYLHEQSEAILKRVSRFNDKLYLEMGGKILYDYHAARVLPGFDPNAKIRLLQKLKDKIDVILCVHAGDLERNKVRADFGITYDVDAFKSIDDMKWFGIHVAAVVITRFKNQPAAITFQNKLELKGIKVYRHFLTKGYPLDVETIVSQEGYGANEYIETTRPIVVVTGPGPGSGKLATSLCNMYHDHKKGIKAGYAKFETFPVWDLPLNHPVNVAYEAATADLRDKNMIDPYHLEAYDVEAVNYNRDIEAFSLLERIIEKITGGKGTYKSPTDMGVNRISSGIVDEKVVKEAANQEVIRRYFRSSVEYIMGVTSKTTLERSSEIMRRAGVSENDRKVVAAARKAAKEAEKKRKGYGGIYSGAAIELRDGTIITGKSSPLFHSSSAMILNATKHLAGLPDNMFLLPESIIDSVTHLKKDILNGKQVSLDVEETLIALAISATSNPAAKMALEKLTELYGCEMHSTHIPTPGDEAGCRKLKVNLTCDPVFSSKRLFVSE